MKTVQIYVQCSDPCVKFELIVINPKDEQQGKLKIAQRTSEIVAAVSEATGVDSVDIMSKSRRHNIVDARRICIVMMRDILKMTQEAIGEVFDLDHTSVRYHYRQHVAYSATDKNYRQAYIASYGLLESNMEQFI